MISSSRRSFTRKKSSSSFKTDSESPETSRRISRVEIDPEFLERFERALSRKKRKIEATKTVSRLYRGKTTSVRRGEYLNLVCRDSGSCLAFGRYMSEIIDYFDGFNTFDYVTHVEKIGNTSINGFVNVLTHSKNRYEAKTILKSAKDQDSDNLYYEYLVGKLFINRMNLFYPCFLETYGIYYYSKLNNLYESLSESRVCNGLSRNLPSLKKMLKDELTLTYNDNHIYENPNEKIRKHLANICKNSRQFCVHIQHFNNVKTLKSHIVNSGNNTNLTIDELPNILYQIYAPLADLHGMFTHYDLHTENVLLYSVPNGKYVQMTYTQRDGKVISFRTRYIAKIIDYGKSYFNDEANGFNVERFYKDICDKRECLPDCGFNYGFSWFEDMDDEYYISSRVPNKSHDLRLLSILGSIIPTSCFDLSNIISMSIKNTVKWDLTYTNDYGTAPLESSGTRINNVIDAAEKLGKMISNPFYQKQNQSLHNKKNEYAGELKIYIGHQREMEYVFP